ncbi:AAA family ATPase [Rathayibacter toxicus]|uniref:AAA family ATPase n=1 Tax=Rathayibacter toxicus TaxID=145458 RepID=UPI000CE88E33|nr:ATP-binding protein [Rathayibacter toxicus]PPI56022.1 chromosome segregation protein SMC [Rathayibacter toxicus]QOD10188.1 ATP-binding protein [Rathayibacter toxicus]QWL28864.1 chromosome segregation protein SMC [Rathayibacter toxicus]QWL33051.1 chromosome segregation protein SMC [Rathayibacter toxicus]QWL35145.1 chromosome segregation protein SMC [Rathayibacter toxicus]
MDATLVELRLPAFKSIRDARLPVQPLTLIVGRNGSGKSNLLDAFAVLSALATGSDLREALDGGRDGPIIRGGSEGCAPLGSQTFELGCSAATETETLHLDLIIQTAPTLQISSEHLWALRSSGPRKNEKIDYLKSETPSRDSADIIARWENGKPGMNPPVTLRAHQLLTSQVPTRVPALSQAGRKVHEVAALMLSAITGVFILDPVPHQMREYVPEKDNVLRRKADNLSAAIRRLLNQDAARQALLEMTSSLSESQVSNLSTVSSDLGDVMITLDELIGGHHQQVPARLMSDGTLRFLAIAVAMLDAPPASDASDKGRILVIEELENGLHPSQAALLLSRLKRFSQERKIRTVATTHSPAILDTLEGKDHNSVVVSSRDSEGWSRVTNLTDFPDYFEVVGRASLGESAVRDDLRPHTIDDEKMHNTLASIFGI